MKLSFILPGYPHRPMGGFSVVYLYANELVKMGYEVSIIHPRFTRNNTPVKNLFNYTKRKVGIIRDTIIKPRIEWQKIDNRVKMIYVPEPLSKYIPDGDIVFATGWQTAEYVLNLPNNKGMKFYLIQHYESWAGPEEEVRNTWLYPMFKIVIAKWLYDYGLKLRIEENEIEHIPNGIDHSKYKIVKGIRNREHNVAMMYSLIEWKGSIDGIRALLIAKEKAPNIKATLFGTCNTPNDLPKWIRYIKNPSQDVLVNDIYNESCIYLCPSWAEGWHLPPAEAMACGCALVSTDIGGVQDYALNRQTALLSKVRDPSALANNLVELIDNDEYRFDIALRANSAIKEFTWGHSARLLDSLIKKIMHEKVSAKIGEY